ncbi:MAG: glycosyltransferase [Romboutsia sp.]
MALISVIVPVYNVEKHLKKSIESLINQTMKDIEIILVNDGSNDDSLQICKEYQKLDSRIIVINKVNGGVSSARNAGLKIASGEFIGFIDPDDWIEKDMYKNMYQKIVDTYSDVSICNYTIDSKNRSEAIKLDIKKEILNKSDIIKDVISGLIGPKNLNSNTKVIMGSVWRLLIKKELINRYNILFIEGIPFMEDLIFSINIFLKSKRIVIDTNTYYHYIIHQFSAVNGYRDNISDINNEVISKIEELLKKENIYESMKGRLDTRYVNSIISSIINEVHMQSPKVQLERIKTIGNLCKDKRLVSILEELDVKDCTFRKKISLIAIKYHCRIYLYIYYNIAMKIL